MTILLVFCGTAVATMPQCRLNCCNGYSTCLNKLSKQARPMHRPLRYNNLWSWAVQLLVHINTSQKDVAKVEFKWTFSALVNTRPGCK